MKNILTTKMLKKIRRSKQRWQKEKGPRVMKQLKAKTLTKLSPTIQIALILIPKCFSRMETEPWLISKRRVSSLVMKIL